MGANACKCDCDKGTELPAGNAVTKPGNAFTEDVENRNPALTGAAATQQAAPKAAEKRPPEQTGETKAVEAPKDTEKKTKQEKQRKDTGSSAASTGLKTLKFELQAKQNLGARFSELPTPEPDGTLVVTSVSESSSLAVTTAGLTGIAPGDNIVSVNGNGGSRANILECLTQAKSAGGALELVVRPRPPQFDIELPRVNDDEKMGIVVAVHTDVPDRVEVRQVCDDGATPKWNQNNGTKQVCAGDWITSVNGSSKDANDMIADMQAAWGKKQTLKIRILSYTTEEMRNKPVKGK